MVGIGQWYPHLRFAHETYQEALGAVRVAARITELGPVIRWTALGVYRAFAHLPEGMLAYSSVHPGLERLFAEPVRQLPLPPEVRPSAVVPANSGPLLSPGSAHTFVRIIP